MAKQQKAATKHRKRKPRKAPRPAARDDFGKKFLKLKGSIDPSVDLEFQRMVKEVDAELVDWALVRVTVGEQVTTHAVGLRMRHIDLEAGHVLTSPVKSIDRGARLLMTQNSTYELIHAIDEFSDGDLAHWSLLIGNRANAVPDRIEWLRRDGSVSKAMDHAEIVATLEEWQRTHR